MAAAAGRSDDGVYDELLALMQDERNRTLSSYQLAENHRLVDRDDPTILRYPLHRMRDGVVRARPGIITLLTTELLLRASQRQLPFIVSLDQKGSQIFILCDTKSAIANYGNRASLFRSIRSSLWNNNPWKTFMLFFFVVAFSFATYELLLHTHGYHDPLSSVLPCAMDMVRQRKVGVSEMYQSVSGGGEESENRIL